MSKHSLTSLASCLSIMLVCLLAITRQDLSAQSQAGSLALPTSLVNQDFEQGTVGRTPDGWRTPASGVGYPAEVVEANPKTGKRSALLQSVPTAQLDGRVFGNLMQTIDGTLVRGRRVRFRAAVRIEGNDAMAHAQLWLRVDRPGQQVGFFDNMGDRPIRSREWQYHEIVGYVDDDAVAVNIGMMLFGKGKAWLDDVSLVDSGKPEPPRQLSERGLENLKAFTRLLGYVRHFHPSDEAAATDWNAFAIEGVNVAEESKDAADLAQKLETLFRPLAPSLRVYPKSRPPGSAQEWPSPKHEPALKVVSYRHIGFGQKTSQGNNIYRTERVSRDASDGAVPAGFPDPQKPFAADLGGGVSVLLPLALYADATGTLPRGVSPAKHSNPAQPVQYSALERSVRLADVTLAWNILQHFYPYFDVVQTDWPRALSEALNSAATDKDEKAFLNTLRRMVATLHDGHGTVYHPRDSMAYAVPVIFGWVEDRLIITRVASQGANGLQPGDVVLKIDGTDAREALAARETLISGSTPQWRRHESLRQLRMRASESELKLEVQPRSGNPRIVGLRPNAESLTLMETRPPQVSEVRPGIFYLDLDRIKDEDFAAVLPKLQNAQGIIFDLRGYPRVSPTNISHLIDKPVESARWLVPIITEPDGKAPATYNESRRWRLEPIAPRLKGKLAFITDGRAISYAESYLGIVEAYQLAAIVGEPTAGTNGNINQFVLPGGYTVVWTGMKVLKHDGSRHHGVGIQPTVPVFRTIRGIAEERDEQLERAISIVSQN